mmetsp:Transcript_8712/g.25680  ORF Transcript_8712/g.25680 Transcript_8712/m.25680 type:complete len:358 (+) Transcript_8712:62-1135(+)
MPPEEQSSSDDALTEEEERLLALDRACDPWLSELTEMPRSPPPLAGSAALALRRCEEEDAEVRRRTEQALSCVRADCEAVRATLEETRLAEDQLDQWREERHTLLRRGLAEGELEGVDEEGSGREDEPLRLDNLVTGFAAEQLGKRRAEANGDGGGGGDQNQRGVEAQDGSRAECSGGGEGREKEQRPGTAVQRSLDLEARGSLRQSLAEADASRARLLNELTRCPSPTPPGIFLTSETATAPHFPQSKATQAQTAPATVLPTLGPGLASRSVVRPPRTAPGPSLHASGWASQTVPAGSLRPSSAGAAARGGAGHKEREVMSLAISDREMADRRMAAEHTRSRRVLPTRRIARGKAG